MTKQFLKLVETDERLEAIPLAITTTENLLEAIEKINCLKIEESPSIIEKIPDTVVLQPGKKRIAGVVTNFIGYALDIHILSVNVKH